MVRWVDCVFVAAFFWLTAGGGGRRFGFGVSHLGSADKHFGATSERN